ncbi:MAG: glycosyltransferase [Planctomycetaceae bacterium]
MAATETPKQSRQVKNVRPRRKRNTPIEALCVIGHPSRVGGADTELDHQIHCWQAMGVEVHVCHTGAIDANLAAMNLEERGCLYHPPMDWSSLDGMHCISFCNGEFLSNLPEIKRHARTTTFVNCMTWNFDREIEMQSQGLIDFHLYQTQHAYERVSLKLRNLGHYRPLFFVPFFHRSDFPFHKHRPGDTFRFGRISRDDIAKHGQRQLWIYETMTAPVAKEGLILGWGDNAQRRFGRRPHSYIHTHPEAAISQQEFYKFCEAIIMTTETFENLPRVGFEAMSSGSVLVVDNRGGWKRLVEDGRTGWLCNDDREFVYKASRCAFEAEERQAMRQAASEKLEAEWGLEAAMKSWDRIFQEWAAL